MSFNDQRRPNPSREIRINHLSTVRPIKIRLLSMSSRKHHRLKQPRSLRHICTSKTFGGIHTSSDLPSALLFQLNDGVQVRSDEGTVEEALQIDSAYHGNASPPDRGYAAFDRDEHQCCHEACAEAKEWWCAEDVCDLIASLACWRKVLRRTAMQCDILFSQIGDMGELFIESIGKSLGAIPPRLSAVPEVEEVDLHQEMVASVVLIDLYSRKSGQPLSYILAQDGVFVKEMIVAFEREKSRHEAEMEFTGIFVQAFAKLLMVLEVRLAACK